MDITLPNIISGLAAAVGLLDPIKEFPRIAAWASSSKRVAAMLAKYLFGNATLQDLPNTAIAPQNGVPRAPSFFINSTNMATGNLWIFSRSYMGDANVGYVRSPSVRLADAVAASAAFPAFTPFILDLTGKEHWFAKSPQEPGAEYLKHHVQIDLSQIDALDEESTKGIINSYIEY
jgi:NTE family protein